MPASARYYKNALRNPSPLRFKACINIQGWLPLDVREDLHRRARICSTHYSTRIEGNRLTLEEAGQVIEGTRTSFHARERDVDDDEQIEPEERVAT